MSITRAAIDKNRITIVLLLIVLLGGWLSYNSLPRAEDPGFPIRSALVITYFPGASPERVELLVTDKIEKAVQQMPELDSVNSTSKTGVSIVTVNIKESYKREELRTIWDSLRRKVSDARGELPDGIIGPNVNDEFGDVFGIVVGVTGDGFSYRELKDIADELRDEILHAPDVAKVDIFGAQEERVVLEYDNNRLSQLGISPAQLQAILRDQNIVSSGGTIRVGDERYALEPSGNFEDIRDIRQTLLQLPGGAVLPLADVVKNIKLTYVDPPSSKFHRSGYPGLALAISMREGGNIINLGNDLKKRLPELEARYPLGIELQFVNFQPKDVSKLVDDFQGNLLQSVGIVLLTMILFLGLRTGLVVASLIPTAVAGSLLLMSVFTIGVDQMSLASLIIALGLLVDNAVVMAESIMVQMAAGKSRVEAAVDSASELMVPLLTSSLTTSAAFLPIFLAESSVGEYTAPLFKVVTITLLCSWLAAITVTPMLCVLFIKVKQRQSDTDPFDTRAYALYRRVLLALVRRPLVTLVGVVLFFYGGLQLFRFIPNLFFPSSNNPAVVVQLDLPVGTAIEKTEAATAKLEAFIQKELQVNDERPLGMTHWATYIGNGGPRFYLGYVSEQSSSAHATLIIAGNDFNTSKVAAARIRQFIREELPDARASAEPKALGPSSKAPVMIEISGPDTDTLFDYVEALKKRIGEVPGTDNVRDDWGQRAKKVVVRIDQQRARRAGVSSQDVAISLQTAFSGFRITEFRDQDKLTPVLLRSVVADRSDVGKIENLAVYAMATGRSVPLKQVADVSLQWEAAKILRKDRRRAVTVLANLEPGVTASSVIAQVVPWLDEQQKDWDRGFAYSLSGEAENSAKANKSIGDKLPIAGFLILLLLVVQFNSIRRTSIILLTLPLGIVGVAIGLVIFRSYFGFMTLLGVVSLSGIVINNAIVLIDRIKIEIEDLGKTPEAAVIAAAQQRLRPILLTTATTIFGLIPLYLGGGPMWEPMAVAMMVGLAFATLLTLGVVPVLYTLMFRVKFKGFVYAGTAAALQDTNAPQHEAPPQTDNASPRDQEPPHSDNGLQADNVPQSDDAQQTDNAPQTDHAQQTENVPLADHAQQDENVALADDALQAEDTAHTEAAEPTEAAQTEGASQTEDAAHTEGAEPTEAPPTDD